MGWSLLVDNVLSVPKESSIVHCSSVAINMYDTRR